MTMLHESWLWQSEFWVEDVRQPPPPSASEPAPDDNEEEDEEEDDELDLSEGSAEDDTDEDVDVSDEDADAALIYDPGLMPITLRPPDDIYDGHTHIFRFESWGDFVERAENGHSDMAYDSRSSREISSARDSWAGTKTFQEAVDLARNGWPEGAQLAKAQLRFLEDLIPSHVMRSEPAYSHVGPGVLDFERLTMGHPEPYMTFIPVEREETGQIVHITYTVSAAGVISPAAMIQKGVVVAALIDLLEASGKRVELTMTGGTGEYHDAKALLILEVVVKRAQDALDLEKIALIAHPATHRRLHFSIKEQAHENIRRRLRVDKDGGYGYSVSVPKDNAINIGAGSIFEGYREADTVKWLQQQLSKVGVIYDA